MTADCSPSWTSWTIKTYFSSLYPRENFILISLLFIYKKKKIYIYIYIYIYIWVPEVPRSADPCFMPEIKLHTQHIPLFLKKVYGLWRFRRFRFLLIHSLVTPKNMEISSKHFGDQSLKIQIVQKCYLSG